MRIGLNGLMRWRVLGFTAIAALQVSCATVANSEASLQRLEPVREPSQTVRLVRSCEVGDCRVQHVEMTLPDGEVLLGTLTIRSAGGRSGVGIANLQTQSAQGTGPNVRFGTLRLSGDRGRSLKCDLLLRIGARHATGTCEGPGDEKYRLEY